MKNKPIIYHISLLVIGLALIIPAFFGLVDEFWNGMGSALAILGGLGLLRTWRLNKNPAYREKVEIAQTDERNRFLRGKAWACSGYLFILISAVGILLFKLAGQDLLSKACSWTVCLMLALYWLSYLILQKKY